MKKSLKLKALSLAASLTMVVSLCALPISTHAEDNVVLITNATELADAIADQKANQTWKISDGTYTLTQDLLNKYSSWTNPGTSQQNGWYFPIHEDNITIIGEGNVTITSDVESANGAWATQDFISVWGNNVTIDNIDILSKEEQNKAIEVMGKDFKLTNSEIKKVDEWGSGSIVFNSSDNGNIGTATLENVKLYSWVSTNYSKTGTLTTKDVTIDFTDNEYAGYKDDSYGYGWCPGIFNNNSNVVVANTGLNIVVDSKINLTEQIFNEKLQDNSTITLTDDVKVDSMVDIQNKDITLNLNGHTLTASDKFTGTYDNDKHLVNVTGENVTIENGTLKTTSANKNVLNVYDTKGVTVKDVTLDHTDAFKGAPLVVNSSDVTLDGKVKFVTGAQSWYAANVDAAEGKTASLDTSGATLTYAGDTSKGFMYTEAPESVTITTNDDQEYEVLADGTIGKAAAVVNGKKYGSVQNAVNVAQDGETVTVKAGKHDEEVKISNKAIKLVGEDGAQLFNVTVVNTTGDELSGLEIKNIDFYGASNKVSLDTNLSTVYIQGKYKDVVIEGNNFVLDGSYENQTTVALVTSSEVNNLTVKDNVIDGYTMSAYHNPNWADTTAKGSQNIVYTGNDIKNVLSGIYFGAVDGVTVTDNTFTKANGIRFAYGSVINEVKNNQFVSRPDDTQYGSYAVRFYDDGVDGTVDLSYNYWGTKDKDTISGLIEKGNVTYTLDTYYVNKDMDELNTDVDIFEFDGLTLNLKVGDTVKVNVTAKDYDGNILPLTWTSENDKVATVKDGVITAVGEGSTKIVVTANGKTITIDVVVAKEATTQPETPTDKPSVGAKPDSNVSTKPTTNTNTDSTDSKPETSDNSQVGLYAACVALSIVGAGFIVYSKKRKQTH